MLDRLIDAYPEERWQGEGQTHWKQILHAATGMKFWFRSADEPFRVPDFGRGVVEGLDKVSPACPTREELRSYLEEVTDRAWRFFDELDDDGLGGPCELTDKLTKADVILEQIRHVQHHVGVSNGLLKAQGLPTAEWI